MNNEELIEVPVSPSETTTTTTSETPIVAPNVNESDATKEVTTVETTEGEAEEKTVEVPSTEEQPEVKTEPTQEERNQKALQAKMSKLEKERNEYAKQVESEKRSRYFDVMSDLESGNQALIDRINDKFSKNPQAYEEFRQQHLALRGQDIGEYNSKYQATQNQQGNQNFNPQDLDRLVDQKLNAKEVERKTTESVFEFWRRVPEMDPRDKSPEDAEVLGVKAQAIGAMASQYMNLYPGMSMEDAMTEAYYALPENRDKQRQIDRESGELAGRAKSLSNSAANTTIAAGGSTRPTPTQSYRLTAAENELYQALKKSDPAKAERYAKRADSYHRG